MLDFLLETRVCSVLTSSATALEIIMYLDKKPICRPRLDALVGKKDAFHTNSSKTTIEISYFP